MKKWNITPHSLRRGFVFLLKVGIIALTILPFYYVLLRYLPKPYYEKGNYLALALYTFIFIALGTPYDTFKIGVLRIRELQYSYMVTLFLVNGITYVVLSLVSRLLLPILPILLLSVFQILLLLLYFIFANWVYYKLYPARDTVIIHNNTEYEKHIAQKFSHRVERYTIRKVLSADDSMENIKAAILENETCILGQLEPSRRQEIFQFCYEHNKRMFVMPTVEDIILQSAHVTQIGDSLLYLVKNRPLSLEQLMIKRAFDIFFSSLFLLITSPLLIVIAIVIKATDGGPVFYKQKRYTRNNEVFEIIKFRSMVVDAEKDGAKFATENDSRITPIGKFIRKTRIDEIPQFINVLKGDMSIVGPRAERVENYEIYNEIIPEFNYRIRVKAGITGYAQIYGKYNTSPEDKARMDIYYIETFSLFNDFKLMISTLKVFFQKESTEGFEVKNLAELEQVRKDTNDDLRK
jgi:exopolysaccharide biosynthesis polyprenyl glycosylphosphotransferase